MVESLPHEADTGVFESANGCLGNAVSVHAIKAS